MNIVFKCAIVGGTLLIALAFLTLNIFLSLNQNIDIFSDSTSPLYAPAECKEWAKRIFERPENLFDWLGHLVLPAWTIFGFVLGWSVGNKKMNHA